MEFAREKSPQKKSTNYFQTTFIWATPILIFEKHINECIEIIIFIEVGMKRGRELCENGDLMVGVI